MLKKRGKTVFFCLTDSLFSVCFSEFSCLICQKRGEASASPLSDFLFQNPVCKTGGFCQVGHRSFYFSVCKCRAYVREHVADADGFLSGCNETVAASDVHKFSCLGRNVGCRVDNHIMSLFPGLALFFFLHHHYSKHPVPKMVHIPRFLKIF